jgi:hypothetical protein
MRICDNIFPFRFLVVVLLCVSPRAWTQSDATLSGWIKTPEGKAVAPVHVQILKTPFYVSSNDSGFYSIKVPAYKQLTISFSCVGYETIKQTVRMEPGQKRELNIEMPIVFHKMQEVTVTGESERLGGLSRINITDFNQLPSTSGNFESIIKTMPGVSSGNELSSQYMVRGGNFDENLVYVNDVEIMRPFLIRSGQQEGLTFINADMVSNVKFSAGGFEARYGDKMSSVLDVTYRKPEEFDCAAQASLLGGNLTIGNSTKNKKWTYLGGLRYKTSQYLLSSLDTDGEYTPSFTDAQALITYQPNTKWEFSLLGNYAQNKYRFVPKTQSTNFGSWVEIYNLTVFYDGQEKDKYLSAQGAFTINYKPTENLILKLVSSGYAADEQETFDIDGAYWVYQLDNTAGSSSAGDSLTSLGAGEMLTHARNYLQNKTWNLSHIGSYTSHDHTLRWSVSAKQQNIHDKLNEWTYIDSLGYIMPYSSGSITLTDYVKGNHHVNMNEYLGFLQDTWQFDMGNIRSYLTAGVRFNYNSFTNEFLVSPRVRFSIKPAWKHDIILFASAGAYPQPPVYKEMRDMHGNLNPNIKAQKSYHFVVGSDYNLKIWDRPFKLTSEVYYKYLTDLIPYKVDNVRLRYTAQNNAVGYAEGIDLKLNGEFVPGIESWASLSVMKTEENQKDDYYIDSNGNRVEPGYYARPTDQRINFSLFFSDYLPNQPTLQMHMTLAVGSSFKVSQPNSERFDKTLNIGPYRRVDIGFSKVLRKAKKNADEAETVSSSLKHFKEFIISAEIFNLLNTANKASYMWIRTIPNQENVQNTFAVPNYLTSRRLNVKIAMKF